VSSGKRLAATLIVSLLCLASSVGCDRIASEWEARATGERGPSRADADRPNIVLITIDTLRADHLGCYGYEPAKTPNIDAFAASATRFELVTTTSNNTLPSHAAILTGRYPHQLGIPRNGYKYLGDAPTLATILSRQGYDTAAFVSASALAAELGLDEDFDVYDGDFDTEEVDQEQRRAPETTRLALRWLQGRGADPFFLWVHYFDPHYPYTPPPPFDNLFYPEYEGAADGSIAFISGISGVKGFPKLETTPEDHRKLIALYDGEIAFLDEHLGELFAILDGEDRRADTLVVLVADHGESLVEHDYYFDHGELAYQPSMRVPLLIRLPGQESGLVVTDAVQTIDVVPTVLGRPGLAAPDSLDGRDLTTLCEGGADEEKPPSFGERSRPWVAEKLYPGQWLNTGKAHFGLAYPWKLIETPYLQRTELYNLAKDPGELDDVAAAHPKQTKRLVRKLLHWRRDAGVESYEIDPKNVESLRALGYIE